MISKKSFLLDIFWKIHFFINLKVKNNEKMGFYNRYFTMIFNYSLKSDKILKNLFLF